MKSLKRDGLVDLAVTEITAQIASGQWPVGTALPGEVKLAEHLGVGRSTVREATRALAKMGMIRSRQGAGTFVTAITPRPTWDHSALASRIVEVFEVRDALESQSAGLAAMRRTDDDLVAIRSAFERRGLMGESDPETFVLRDLDFHRAVVIATHNELLLQLFDSFIPALAEALTSIAEETAAVSHIIDPAHGELVEAIAARDPERAMRAARTNFDTTVETVSRTREEAT